MSCNSWAVCVFFFHGTSDGRYCVIRSLQRSEVGILPRSRFFFRWWWSGWSNKVRMDLWWPNKLQVETTHVGSYSHIPSMGLVQYIYLTWMVDLFFSAKSNIQSSHGCHVGIDSNWFFSIVHEKKMDGWWFAWCSLLQSHCLFVIPQEYFVLSGKRGSIINPVKNLAGVFHNMWCGW